MRSTMASGEIERVHSCSGCVRLERSPGGTHWKALPYHGAHPTRTSNYLDPQLISGPSTTSASCSHRMAGISQQRNPSDRPARQRASVKQGPFVGLVRRSNDREDLVVPTLECGKD